MVGAILYNLFFGDIVNHPSIVVSPEITAPYPKETVRDCDRCWYRVGDKRVYVERIE